MSNKPFLVGITGGIGTGKSTVCKIFHVLGVPVYNADLRAKWLMANDASVKKDILKNFGPESYNGDILNRKFIASKVFNNPERLAVLNGIVHPAVHKDFHVWLQDIKHPYILKEAALMFESGSNKEMDRMITVSCPESLRIQRVLTRDTQRSREDVKNIIERQMPEKDKIKMSDHVIYNDELNMLVPQVLKLDELFILLHKHKPTKKHAEP